MYIYYIYTDIYKFTSNDYSQTTHPWRRDIQFQERFLGPSANNQTASMTQNAQTTIPPYQH